MKTHQIKLFIYLIFTWLITGFILTRYVQLLEELMPVGHAYREYWICGGQILFQGLIISLFARKQLWIYLANMMTISLAGALLLVPALLAAKFFSIPVLFYAIYFIGVAGLMFLAHIRRTGVLKLGNTLTCTWVIYRVMILFTLLFV